MFIDKSWLSGWWCQCHTSHLYILGLFPCAQLDSPGSPCSCFKSATRCQGERTADLETLNEHAMNMLLTLGTLGWLLEHTVNVLFFHWSYGDPSPDCPPEQLQKNRCSVTALKWPHHSLILKSCLIHRKVNEFLTHQEFIPTFFFYSPHFTSLHNHLLPMCLVFVSL